MESNFIIALDGPASSGKSTTARLLAQRLKYIYIDTGAMYRACALFSIEKKIDLDDFNALEWLLDNVKVRIEYNEVGNRVILNDEDVTERIREADVTEMSSKIATLKLVRKKMVDLQRRMGRDGGVIMDGRDIGTVVFPGADFKFFIIADLKTRAQRRWMEFKEKGIEKSLEEIEKDLRWRDRNDTNREVGPLRKAEDAIELDTTSLTIEEQVNILYNLIARPYENDL